MGIDGGVCDNRPSQTPHIRGLTPGNKVGEVCDLRWGRFVTSYANAFLVGGKNCTHKTKIKNECEDGHGLVSTVYGPSAHGYLELSKGKASSKYGFQNSAVTKNGCQDHF